MYQAYFPALNGEYVRFREDVAQLEMVHIAPDGLYAGDLLEVFIDLEVGEIAGMDDQVDALESLDECRG